jgi:hypothetical protein
VGAGAGWELVGGVRVRVQGLADPGRGGLRGRAGREGERRRA